MWCAWINTKNKGFYASNVLSDIDNYELLAKILFDFQVPTDSSYGKYNILAGTQNDLKVTGTDFSTPTFTVFSLPVIQTNSGARINSPSTAGSGT